MLPRILRGRDAGEFLSIVFFKEYGLFRGGNHYVI